MGGPVEWRMEMAAARGRWAARRVGCLGRGLARWPWADREEQWSEAGRTVRLASEWALLPDRRGAQGQQELVGVGAVPMQGHHRRLLRGMHQA